jgi:ribosome recycling factor
LPATDRRLPRTDHWQPITDNRLLGADPTHAEGETMLSETYEETRDRMAKSIESLQKEMKRVRTGRASLSLLDGVRVDYYGTLTPLNQMASLSVPESRLIVIQPWDVSVIKAIEKGILKSDLGLTPSSDGKLVRIAIPPLTEERRKELVKVVNKICEEYKVAVRNIRRDANEMVKELKKEGEISEDEAFKAQDEIQKITDEYVGKVDEVYAAKEKEILEF